MAVLQAAPESWPEGRGRGQGQVGGAGVQVGGAGAQVGGAGAQVGGAGVPVGGDRSPEEAVMLGRGDAVTYEGSRFTQSKRTARRTDPVPRSREARSPQGGLGRGEWAAAGLFLWPRAPTAAVPSLASRPPGSAVSRAWPP